MSGLDARLAELRAAGRAAPAGGRSLGEVAIAQTAADPDRIIVMTAERSFTRAELFDAACRLGGALVARGIGRGAAIGFQLPNWWEACVINLAAALFGYRQVPLLTIYRAAELGHIFPACGLEAVFVPERFRNFDHAGLVAGIPGAPRHIFTVRGEPSAPEDFASLLRHAPATPDPASADDIKMILFTSGSTGRPKGVMHSYAGIDALMRVTGERWGFGPADRLYVPSPIGHIGGSLYAFEFPWVSGCTAILAESWSADEAVRTMETLGCTFMAGATPFLSGLIEASERAGTHLPELRRFICGGASVSPDLVRRGLERFPSAVVSRAYGSTEIPLLCPGIGTREEAEARVDTDGEVAIEIAILGDDDRPVAEGEAGEIVARGPQMLMGYLDPADEEGCFTTDGFFRMGDLGRLVAGRFLEITGRKKDIIIRKGENISPLEIENALLRHPAVGQAAVVGTPDRERGEMVVAFVLPAAGQQFTFAEMTAHLERCGLARQKFPERLHVVEALPVNSVGKIQKIALRALAEEAAAPG